MLLCTFIRNLSYFPQNVLQHATYYFRIFSGFFEDIPRNIWRHSPECMATLPGIFGDIPRKFEDIPRNVWPHSPEYNIPPIPRVPRIPFPVPVFLVLYIAHYLLIHYIFLPFSHIGSFNHFLNVINRIKIINQV